MRTCCWTDRTYLGNFRACGKPGKEQEIERNYNKKPRSEITAEVSTVTESYVADAMDVAFGYPTLTLKVRKSSDEPHLRKVALH